MGEFSKAQKVLVVGAGPVGALAALYAAERGDDVHVYELRAGKNLCKPELIEVHHQHPHFRSIPLLTMKYSLFCFNQGRGLLIATSYPKRIYLLWHSFRRNVSQAWSAEIQTTKFLITIELT